MSYLKKIGALFVSSALLAAALTGCGSSSGSTSDTGSQAEGGDGNYNISIVFKTTSNEYTQYMIAGAKKAAEETGAVLDMKGATSETAYDEQQNMIETDLHANKYDAMIIAPLQGDMATTLVSGTDMPIFAIDTDFDAPEKISFIGIGQKDAAASGGSKAVEAAKAAGWDKIEAAYIAGVQGDSTADARRTGFQELEKKLTGARVLTGEGGIGAQFRPVPTKTAAPQSQSVLTAFLEETAQLSPVLARGEISVVYLDADGFNPDQWRDIADRCHDRGKQCWLALPQIFRSHAQRYLGANRHLLCQAGFDGVLIRALEEAVWLKDLMEQENQKTSLPFGMDASVYGWNSRSAEVLASMGTSLLTMPWELNSRELEPVLASCRGLGLTSELISY